MLGAAALTVTLPVGRFLQTLCDEPRQRGPHEGDVTSGQRGGAYCPLGLVCPLSSNGTAAWLEAGARWARATLTVCAQPRQPCTLLARASGQSGGAAKVTQVTDDGFGTAPPAPGSSVSPSFPAHCLCSRQCELGDPPLRRAEAGLGRREGRMWVSTSFSLSKQLLNTGVLHFSYVLVCRHTFNSRRPQLPQPSGGGLGPHGPCAGRSGGSVP